ncbi:hypothetical protein, partial [Dysosmobacter sp.]|uniref:hypothetical protein n=1 Tax=Dysosmobacter sp. TaxID=2591382 RepID=UPI003AB3C10E
MGLTKSKMVILFCQTEDMGPLCWMIKGGLNNQSGAEERMIKLPIDKGAFGKFVDDSDIFRLTQDAMKIGLENW